MYKNEYIFYIDRRPRVKVKGSGNEMQYSNPEQFQSLVHISVAAYGTELVVVVEVIVIVLVIVPGI